MSEILRYFRDFFVSIKLTVVLIAFSILLVFAATLDQANLGIWGIQQKWFHTFVVFQDVGGVALPLFPGGYLIGGLLLINLLAAHIYRFQFLWRKTGILLTHVGLILLLVGELLSGIWQEEYFMRLNNGETKNYAESYRTTELAITDTTDPAFDNVVAIPDVLLERHKTVQNALLPFRVVPKAFYPNSLLQSRPAGSVTPTLATLGAGLTIDAAPQPASYKENADNTPAAYVELVSPDGSLGTFLVSTGLMVPQSFTYAGRTWKISLRAKRLYRPFSLTLEKFSHDRYAGTDIPKNFSSRIHLNTPGGREDRDVVIYMNNPLRYAGLTFYQAGFANNDRTTVLQVVRNPSWLIPYIACSIMAAGLLIQFGIHLFGFVKRRRFGTKKSKSASNNLTTSAPLPERPASKSALVGKYVPLLFLGLAVVFVVFSLREPHNPDAYDLVGFGRLPTLVNGRLKPLDTVARTTLLTTQGRQRVVTADGRTLSPEAWLLDVLYDPASADTYPTFEIVHPDVLTLFDLTAEQGAGKKRFSLTQLAKHLPDLERQANLAEEDDAAVRTPFQRAVVQLRSNIALYQHLQASLVPPGMDDYLDRAAQFPKTIPAGVEALRAQRTGQPHDAALTKGLLELSQTFATMDALGYLLLVPPETDMDKPSSWKSAGASLQDSLTTGRLNPAATTYIALGVAWRGHNPEAFNAVVKTYRAQLEAGLPARLTKCDVETRFNAAQPFYTSMVLYVAAFLIAVISWLKWPDALGRAAFWLVVTAFVLATAGIVTRMWLESRPPVTNLYSSALFVGWGAVALCLVLEAVYKNAIGSVAAGLIGFATLLVAHHLALAGDTMEMMRAVLDSNFWLATHVVTVTTGYAATFLAGFLALIYVMRGVFTRSLDAKTAEALSRMVYGIVCFATLFSFVGTVLGGIWADQSWGRFWGWDPKENGALIIVLWNALALHARWGGLVKARGFMNLAIFGNIVTAWSWFGVNMLGVGLHSYGFMAAAFWWLLAFVAVQVAVMLLAALPTKNWRSFAGRA
ncbi:MAG TPA: cytochrome c biogenesis protein CcsA [Rariglobus sp.]|jgi:ABC-type transport system involved in cytochrome c biogenesis permease subunit|nr:cytochrome c biogenesis protein CcsA [Rariglobus sp.]